MKLLMFTTDRSVFDPSSKTAIRFQKYGTLVQELAVVAFTLHRHKNSRKSIHLAHNVVVYPTDAVLKIFYLFQAYRIGARILRQWSIGHDQLLISAQDPFEIGFVAMLLAKRFRALLQVQIHTDALDPWFKRESLINRIRSYIAIFIIKRANGIRVVSERIADTLLRRIPELRGRIAVLPIFVEITSSRPSAQDFYWRGQHADAKTIFLVASRLTKEKNVAMVIRAMARIVKKYPGTLLLIVGSGGEQESLKKEVRKYKLNDHVVFEGWKDDLLPYYRTASVFILASNYEGYGRTIVESLAAGCPVITTDVGIAAQLVVPGKSGILIQPNDEDALVKAMESVANGDSLLKGILPQQAISSEEEYLKAYRAALNACATKNSQS